MKTEHFYVGFADDNQNRGQIYLNHTLFANFFKCPSDWGASAGKFQVNRDWIAGKIKYDGENLFDDIASMLKYLQKWYCEKTETGFYINRINDYMFLVHKRPDGLYYASIEKDLNILFFTAEFKSDIEAISEVIKIIERLETAQNKR